MKLLVATLFISFCCLPLCYGAPQIAEMSESERKDAGIEKLTPEEKHALDLWIAKVMPKPALPPVIEKRKIVHGEFAIKETKDFGRFITLENGVTYEFPSRTRKKTMAWKVGEKVRVIEPVRPVNYKLENLDHDQTVGGKIAQPKNAPELSK